MKCAENVVSLTVQIQQLYNICERSKLFSAFNGPEFRYIYIGIIILFQVDNHSIKCDRI